MSAGVPARILVIEDSGTNRALMVYLLKARGYVPLEASDGEGAIRVARHERPELIVCDIQSSKLDGYGVVREIKSEEALSHIPTVAVTMATTPAEHERILAAGFDGYVGNPSAPDVFVREVEEFLPPEQRSKPAREGV